MSVLDQWTRVVDRALDVVLVKYPARTGLGAVLGSTLSFLVQLLGPILHSVTSASFAAAPWWGWFALGVLIMHIPTIISLFKQKSIGDAQIDMALDLIARGNFTQAEMRRQYRRLIDRVVENVAMTQVTHGGSNKGERVIVSLGPSSTDE